MPIVIDSYEADGDGGYYIKWTDPSQPVTAFTHVTPELMDEFEVHHRRGRGAPVDKLHAARDGMRDKSVSDAATVQRIRKAYGELVDDIKDLKARGLRHNTPHAEHEKMRKGGPVSDKWLKKPKVDGFDRFVGRA